MKILNNRGQGLTEYLILLMLVAVVSISAVSALGNTVKRKIQSARGEINRSVTFRDNHSDDSGDSNDGGLFN